MKKVFDISRDKLADSRARRNPLVNQSDAHRGRKRAPSITRSCAEAKERTLINNIQLNAIQR
jgi:hypothetical protein